MKKLFALIMASLVLYSCGKEEKLTQISGKLENIETDSIYIVGSDYRKAIPVTMGEFSDTIALTESSYFTFIAGNERAQIFLNPNDSLHISVDGTEFDESLHYTGSSAKENKFLAADYLLEEKIMEDPSVIFAMEPEAFKTIVSELKSTAEKALNDSKAASNFKELQTKNNTSRYLTLLLQYPEAYHYFANKEVQLPEGFLKELDQMDLHNEKDFVRIPNYKELVLTEVMSRIDKTNSPEEIESIVSQLKSQKMKEEVLQGLLYEITTVNPDAESYHTIIQKHSKDDKLIKGSTDKITAIKSVLPGNPSPKFDYPDINGKQVKLDDLKGKLVYIDVWATWCGPCIQEIPSLKKLETDYHGKNIEFVSISIDVKKDFEKWQKMVKDKDLKGIQLFADKDWKSDFVKAYAIDGIPRFILVGKDGNILNPDAPRPSDAQIRSLLDANM